MQISYAYLAVLLVFALLTGVVIGDRLAANAIGPDGRDGGRSGGCSGLASWHLHACVHRLGTLNGRPGRDAGCGPVEEEDNGREND